MLKIVDNYTLNEFIGQGAYGKVYRATDHETHQHVAIKAISLDKFAENPKLAELTKQEINLISSLENNPNVIKFVEVIKSNRYLYMVYEYCEGGTLEGYLMQQEKGAKSLCEKEALQIFRQLINAMKGLYEKNVIHRDIKPDNIFLKQGQVKLADFGFCKQLTSENDLTQTSLGSPLYMAPEVLNHDVYSTKADVWSCGIVLYQMLYGECPFGTCNIKELLDEYKSPYPIELEHPSIKISTTVQMMLSRMLVKDQFKRISWEELLYEYSFDDKNGGRLIHKDKDFEYDLMKLIKKNNSAKGSSGSQKYDDQPQTKKRIVKFDWEKLTDTNDMLSSVHSEECDYHQHHDKNSNHHQQHHEQQHHQQQQLYENKSYSKTNRENELINNLNYEQLESKSKSKSQPEPENYEESCFSSISLITNKESPNNILEKTLPQPQNEYINKIYQLKKKINYYENEHTKVCELVNIIENMLLDGENGSNGNVVGNNVVVNNIKSNVGNVVVVNGDKTTNNSTAASLYDTRIVYFLIYNLQSLLSTNSEEVGRYLNDDSIAEFLNKYNLTDEKDKLIKLERIFTKENEKIKPKLNAIKSILLTLEEAQSMQIFKYPSKPSVLKSTLKEYLENIELENDGILDMLLVDDVGVGVGVENKEIVSKGQKEGNWNKEIGIKLLKILWGLNLISKSINCNNCNNCNNCSNNNKTTTTTTTNAEETRLQQQPQQQKYNLLRVGETNTKKEISILLNKYMFELGI